MATGYSNVKICMCVTLKNSSGQFFSIKISRKWPTSNRQNLENFFLTRTTENRQNRPKAVENGQKVAKNDHKMVKNLSKKGQKSNKNAGLLC